MEGEGVNAPWGKIKLGPVGSIQPWNMKTTLIVFGAVIKQICSMAKWLKLTYCDVM